MTATAGDGPGAPALQSDAPKAQVEATRVFRMPELEQPRDESRPAQQRQRPVPPPRNVAAQQQQAAGKPRKGQPKPRPAPAPPDAHRETAVRGGLERGRKRPAQQPPPHERQSSPAATSSQAQMAPPEKPAGQQPADTAALDDLEALASDFEQPPDPAPSDLDWHSDLEALAEDLGATKRETLADAEPDEWADLDALADELVQGGGPGSAPWGHDRNVEDLEALSARLHARSGLEAGATDLPAEQDAGSALDELAGDLDELFAHGPGAGEPPAELDEYLANAQEGDDWDDDERVLLESPAALLGPPEATQRDDAEANVLDELADVFEGEAWDAPLEAFSAEDSEPPAPLEAADGLIAEADPQAPALDVAAGAESACSTPQAELEDEISMALGQTLSAALADEEAVFLDAFTEAMGADAAEPPEVDLSADEPFDTGERAELGQEAAGGWDEAHADGGWTGAEGQEGYDADLDGWDGSEDGGVQTADGRYEDEAASEEPSAEAPFEEPSTDDARGDSDEAFVDEDMFVDDAPPEPAPSIRRGALAEMFSPVKAGSQTGAAAEAGAGAAVGQDAQRRGAPPASAEVAGGAQDVEEWSEAAGKWNEEAEAAEPETRAMPEAAAGELERAGAGGARRGVSATGILKKVLVLLAVAAVGAGGYVGYERWIQPLRGSSGPSAPAAVALPPEIVEPEAETEASLRRDIASHPEAAESYLRLATLLESSGRADEAELYRARATAGGTAPAAAKPAAARPAAGSAPDVPASLPGVPSAPADPAVAAGNAVERGLALEGSGDAAAALAAYEEALSLDSKHHDALLHRGTLQMALGRLDAGYETLSHLVRMHPASALGHNALGLVLRQKAASADDVLKAITVYEKALELDPMLVNAYTNLGSAHELLGNAARALELRQKAVELAPDNAEARAQHGLSLLGAGRSAEARAELEEAVRLDPTEGVYRSNLGYWFVTHGLVEQSLAHYQKAIQLQPENAYHHSERGSALLMLGRHDEAIASFERAIELDPRTALHLSNLAFAQRAKGNVSEALRLFEKAAALAPEDSQVQLGMASVLESLRKTKLAIDAYKRAILYDGCNYKASYNLAMLLQSSYRYKPDAINEWKRYLDMVQRCQAVGQEEFVREAEKHLKALTR
jgi:tetratricopeptide (TPR) repeat protein